MDANAREISDSKMEFRKPSNDAGCRRYRRRSPVGGSSSSSDGSPQRRRSSSPVPSRKDRAKVADDKRRKDGDRDLDRDYRRNQSGRSNESYKRPDRQDDHGRHDRHVDNYDRGYSKLSYRSDRDSRGDRKNRSRDYPNDADKYSQAKCDDLGHRVRDKDSSDRAGYGRRHANIDVRDRDRDRYGKTDNRRLEDSKSDRSPAYDDSRPQRNEPSSRRDSSELRLKEVSQRDTKEVDGGRSANEEKRRHDDDSKSLSSKHQDSVVKKTKFSLDSTGSGTDGQAYVKDSDIDAAKIAAMKAAELVNKNLVGTGFMSTDQKKKLLWGNKKTTTSEESTHRWDTAKFGDRERQEKFNKLMSLRLRWYLLPIVGSERRRKCGAKARQSRYREATRAASDGFGEAIYSWVAPARWSNCWARSLRFYSRYLHSYITVFSVLMLYFVIKLYFETLNFYCMRICWSLIITGVLNVVEFKNFIVFFFLCMWVL